MASLDELPPDQRATLQLLLKQGRSYDEIATMLRIEPRAVRERARAALDAMGPEDVDDLELEEQDDVADYLLGQQSASRRAATRELLEDSSGARAWARIVAGELRPLAGEEGLPEIPSDAAEVDEAFDALDARTAHRERTEKSSRIGGAILLGGLVVVVLVIVLFVTGAFDGDDDDSASSGGETTAQTTGTTSTTPQVEAQINLQPPEGSSSEAQGVAQIARQGNQRVVALVAEGLPAASSTRFYAIWLYTSPSKAKFLGFPNPQPDKSGQIQTGFSLPTDAGDFDELVVTRETKQKPTRPGTIVLRAAQQQSGQ